MKGETLIKYIQEHCTQVAKLPKPLTIEEANRLLGDHEYSDILNILGEMENKRDLLKKYRSAYLTAKKFLEFKQNRREAYNNKHPQLIGGHPAQKPRQNAPLQANISKEKFFAKHPVGTKYTSPTGTTYIVEEDFLISEDGQTSLPITHILRRIS